jgi:hypothetical protein
MKKTVFSIEQDGKTMLGFDTGLDAQAFAQAKIPQFITRPGHIVYPDGRLELWQPGGVIEYRSGSDRFKSDVSMVVWGPLFPGERVDEIVNDPGRRDEALNVICYWLNARTAMEAKFSGEDSPLPGPTGAFVVVKENAEGYPLGSVFFPPARLSKRSLDAEGDSAVLEAARWVHPDLEGAEGISFTSAVMLYRILSGASPFTRGNMDELHEDIREGVFVPPNLAAPGLEPEMAALIANAMSSVAENKQTKIRPSPDDIYKTLSPSQARHVSTWLKPVAEEELLRVKAELEQFNKKKARSVKTRRFVVRNTTIIVISLVVLIVVGFSVYGAVKRQAEKPNTKGMSAVEVAETFYSAISALDHETMEGCVTGKAGKNDVEMVVNFFVMTRMRMAYEMEYRFYMPAQEWINNGKPDTQMLVFGVTDLKIRSISRDDAKGNAVLEADYLLWMPSTGFLSEAELIAIYEAKGEIPMFGALSHKDKLTLTLRRGSWHISGLERESKVYYP